MVTKSFTCPNGHRWRNGDLDAHPRCPFCGAKSAETVGNDHEQLGSTGTRQAGAGDASSDDAQRSQLGRYMIIEELGRGGMGIVYRAFDPVHERQVALKTLPSTDPILLSRFKREFRVLAGLDHPHVARLFELTSDGEKWFFTMELVDGVELLHYIVYGSTQPSPATTDPALTESGSSQQITRELNLAEQIERLRDGFAQLTAAIAALHVSGIIHRDIKPSNALVTRDGRVVLLDFGLIAETDSSGSHLSQHQQVMGTVAYMSPEQAACDPVTPASDWYSMGVMLYEALTGRLPFSGNRLDVLATKRTTDPVPARQIESSVPQDLSDLCVALLSRRPEGRPDAEEILQRLGKQQHERLTAKEPRPHGVPLVGRESHLRALHDAYRVMLDGQAQVVFLRGPSGDGKTALAETFLEQTTGEGAVVLKGRCYEMETVPFKAIDSLVDSLVAYLARLSREEAAAFMPRDIQALVRMFPVIGQVDAVANLSRRHLDVTDQQELNRRAMGALRDLLARIGDRCPLVVSIDDLQWGDEDSAAMLSNLLQPPDPPLLLFLGTYRSEDADTSQFLQSFWRIQRQREFPLASLQIEVGPLERRDAVTLALNLLQRDGADAQRSADAIAQEAAGNPFFIWELVKQFQQDGGRAAEGPAGAWSLADMIWSRVQQLPDESQQLLAVVALRGQPLPLDQAMRIADVGQAAVGPLRAGHLIRTVGLASSSKIETYHDRVRESVSGRLDVATRQRHHFRIAEEYARQSPRDASDVIVGSPADAATGAAQTESRIDVVPEWYDIAFHFDAAGRPDLAFPFALATAENARAQFSLEVAEQQFRIAERGADGRQQVVRGRVAEGLADVLMLRGNYDEAQVRFARALELSPNSAARIEAKLGELAFKQGDMQRAIEVFERILRLLGERVPRSSLGVYCLVGWEALVQILHSLLPSVFVARKPLKNVEKQLLVIRLLNRLAYAYFFERGRYLCLWCHLRGMNLAERYPPTLELAHAYSSHGPAMGLVGFFRRGIAYVQKSFAIYTSIGDLWGQGQALSFHGILLYAASRFEECLEKSREAIRVLERAGDLWELNAARVHVAFSLYRLGDLTESADLARRIHFSGVELGDSKASGFSLDVWAYSTGGKVAADVLRAELQRPRRDVQVRIQVKIADGVRLLMEDRVDDAVTVLEEGYRLAEQAGLQNAYVLPVRSWLASALRRQAENTLLTRRSTVLKRANRVARSAVGVARTFQNDLPHALREAGLISALQGSQRQSRRYLEESLWVAQRQKARFEYAQTLMARGRVGTCFGWPGAADEAVTARQALIDVGADFAIRQFAVREDAEGLRSPKGDGGPSSRGGPITS